jgi:hypothetical protein
MSSQLPEPSLTKVYRLEVTLGSVLDGGDLAQGRRRIIPQTGGTFTGPALNGKLLPGASADWQIITADGTAFGDIRYTLETDRGELLYVQSTQIETAAADLDWLNKGVFIGVGARQPGGVIYETYLVG